MHHTCLNTMQCLKRPEENLRDTWAGVIDGSESPCREPNLSALQEQPVLLTPEPPLQPFTVVVMYILQITNDRKHFLYFCGLFVFFIEIPTYSKSSFQLAVFYFWVIRMVCRLYTYSPSSDRHFETLSFCALSIYSFDSIPWLQISSILIWEMKDTHLLL